MKMKNKGITLVALVITIIVLIILTGVVISLSLSENGIFNKAEMAKEEYNLKSNEEKIEIDQMANQIDTIASDRNTEEGYKKKLEDILSDNGIQVDENESFDSMLEKIDVKLKNIGKRTLVYDMGTALTPLDMLIDCTEYEGWQNFTTENFAVIVTGIYANGAVNRYYTFSDRQFSYDSNTGKLYIERLTGVNAVTDYRYTAKVYLYK